MGNFKQWNFIPDAQLPSGTRKNHKKETYYIYIYIYIYIYAYAYTVLYICNCLHEYKHTHVHIHMYVSMHTQYKHKYMQTSTCTSTVDPRLSGPQLSGPSIIRTLDYPDPKALIICNNNTCDFYTLIKD